MKCPFANFILLIICLILFIWPLLFRVHIEVAIDQIIDGWVMANGFDVFPARGTRLLLRHPIGKASATEIVEARHEDHCLINEIVTNWAGHVLGNLIELSELFKLLLVFNWRRNDLNSWNILD